MRTLRSRLRNLVSRLVSTPREYEPERYWEGRADELIHAYDDPSRWSAGSWPDEIVEQTIVPELLREHDVQSVLVVGAGTGRQYAFVKPMSLEVRGFDLSPTLAAACRTRFPDIPTGVGSVIGAERWNDRADAVLATAVLQHITPYAVPDAVKSIKRLANKLVIVREVVWMATDANYQWAHNYDVLFQDWEACRTVVTDDTPRYRIELRAWRHRISL